MTHNLHAEKNETIQDEQPDAEALLNSVTAALLEKKGGNIKVLDVRELTTLTDFFVVCHGSSDTQIKALARHVPHKVREHTGEYVWRKEGLEARRWVILDYVNVVVHIFNEEAREHYGLEKMWNDAEITEIKDEE